MLTKNYLVLTRLLASDFAPSLQQETSDCRKSPFGSPVTFPFVWCVTAQRLRLWQTNVSDMASEKTWIKRRSLCLYLARATKTLTCLA